MKMFDILYRIGMFIAFVSFFVLIVLLSSCEQKGGDGYYFEQETKVETELTVRVVMVESRQAMSFLAESYGADVGANREIMAFTRISPGYCTLYMLDPRMSLYEPEWIGHEFTHCVMGEWHKIQP